MSQKTDAIPEPAVSSGPERVEIGQAVYEEVGNCNECGTKVYRWVDNGHKAHEAMANSLVVYVAYSSKEPPGLFCQQHDPNKQHRANSPILTPGMPKAGDTWRPRA